MKLPDNIVFDESYVLSIDIKPYDLVMRMDFRLGADHPLYKDPIDGARGCFRRGRISVFGFHELQWASSRIPAAVDANCEVDFGCLDTIEQVSDDWIFVGDWGELRVSGGEFDVVLSE